MCSISSCSSSFLSRMFWLATLASHSTISSRNSDQLENGPYVRKSADYAWQLFFACTAIIVSFHLRQVSTAY